MKNRVPPELDDLASQIGGFIKYWGFRKIDGTIWAHLYLSPTPLSASDLVTRLGVSKALVSLSINELLSFEVIEEVGKGDFGTILYRSRPNLSEVIENVLRSREMRMLSSLEVASRILIRAGEGNKLEGFVDMDRAKRVENMVQQANTLLNHFLALSSAIPALDEET